MNNSDYGKAFVLFYAIFVCWGVSCQGQVITPDSISLPQYQVEPCMNKFLKTIFDSNKVYYDTKKYFYSLTFREARGCRYLQIRVEKWLEARDTDYVGILQIDGVSFLCRGDLAIDPIFKLLPRHDIKVGLERDTHDPNDYVYINEPSLQGSYDECPGLPIHLEVYTKGRIQALERRVHPLKDK